MMAASSRLLAPVAAHAEEAGGGGEASASLSTADVPAPGDDKASNATSEKGAFLMAGKVGGIASFNHLTPFVIGGVELGYVFGGTKRRLAVMLDATYTAPSADGTGTETFNPSRVADNTYKWEIRQKELVLQPTLLYRLTGVAGGKVTPYAGIGPRIYLLQTVSRGSAGGQTFMDSKEQSTKVGVGVPLGAELALGPGGLFAELLFQWGPLTHEITGDTHLGSGSLFLGYRALL